MNTVVIANVVLVDAAGDVLLLRRSSTHPTLAFHPDLPGGEIESDEEHGTGLIREVLEETGLVLEPKDVRLIYSASMAVDNTTVKEKTNHVRLLYTARLSEVRPLVTISWEHDQFEWLPLTEIMTTKRPLSSFYKNSFEHIHQNNLLAHNE